MPPVEQPETILAPTPELDFCAIFGAAPTAYLLVRADEPRWTILAASDEFCRITRQLREKLIGRGTFEAFPESYGTESSHGKHNVRSSFEGALSTTGRLAPSIQRYDLLVSDGVTDSYEEHYWRMSSAPVLGADAGSVAVLHAIENVTEQVFATRNEQEARAAARTAEDRLRMVFVQAPVGIAVLRGAEHRFESANSKYIEVVGRGDLIGKTMREAFPDLEGQGIIALLDEAFDTGEPFVADEMLLRLDRYHDGGLYDGYFDFVYQPLRDSRGVVEGIAVVMTDVSTVVHGRKDAEGRESATAELNEKLRRAAIESDALRARAEQARREAEESERLFRTTANAAPVLIWTTGPDRGGDWFNQPWLDYTGRTMEQEIGNGWQKGVHPDDLDRCLAIYEKAFDERAEFSVEYRLRRANGEYRWILDNGVPRHDLSFHFSGYIGSCMDVTDLRLAREAAENANRAKADFLAAISHELRTPLNAISGYAQLMEMGLHGPITDQQRNALQRIQRSRTVLSRLIEDVLNFARIDSGHMAYNVTDVGVDELLEGVEVFVAPQLELKGLRYDYSHTDRDVTIRADRDKVEQIMLNLLSNAIKFTDAGRISVDCEMRERDVLVRVRDTGRGIPADKLQSVFEPFVQVDSGLKRGTGGTGLGLAISRELARGMSGDITAQSDYGAGTVFTLTLPRS